MGIGASAEQKIAATTKSQHPQGSPAGRPVEVDDDAGIRAVLTADDDVLEAVLVHDVTVRHALRWRPADPEAEGLRTLVAAARVEQRRRHGAAALAEVVTADRRCRR